MSRSRATFGVDVTVDLAGRALRSSLERELRHAVQLGRVQPGTRLPSSRAFARDLGIGRNTVADAYGQLVAEGWFVTRHGSGTWVAERPVGAVDHPAGDVAESRVRYDLRPGMPNLGGFPRSAWLAAARRALAIAADRELGYGDPRGLRVLRQALSGYAGRARRVTASADRVVVCAGFARALELISEVLRRRGVRNIAVEAYGHRLHRRIIAAAGLQATAVAVDRHGAVVAEIGDAGAAGAALLTPAHQFPIGVALDPARRRQAIVWAADAGGILLEDDYDGEFRFDRQAVGAMQSLAPEHVVYAGTASKSLAPGLRLGWLVLPAPLVDEVVAVMEDRGVFPSALDQLTLAELLQSGGFDRQVRRARLAYRRRRERLLGALADVPDVTVSGIAAGLHALVHLPGRDEAEVVERASRHGLAVDGLRAFTHPGYERGAALVVGYATPPDHAFTSSLARLRAVLRG